MCGANSPRKPKAPAPVAEPKVELGAEKKTSELRARRASGISALRTGLNVASRGSGLSIPKR